MQKPSLRFIITASSLGTLIEWYDFYIFGSLAAVIATKFFPEGNPALALLSTLATFAAGFVVRPFGALFFGRLGDLIGRKYTFMATLLLMGSATFLIGCIPSYTSIGIAAPLLVLLLRLLQGLALGGEYGGAATYVAEHAPEHRRGYWTSWIQTTATAGLLLSLLVIISVKGSMSAEAFQNYGWRIPFWISALLVLASALIRRRMQESPVFAAAKAAGTTSTSPLRDSLGKKSHLKYVLLALFGAAMGQGVVWYTGQFYALGFLQNTLHIGLADAGSIVMWALLAATPFFIFFGWLSDRIGRKWIMLCGMLLAVIAYRPIYRSMYEAGTLQGVQMLNTDSTFNKSDSTHSISQHYTDGSTLSFTQKNKNSTPNNTNLKPGNNLKWTLSLLVFLQVFLVTMVYGPIAAFLVELFPVQIRYTSMSVPYHIGNGIFGGLLPAIATFLSSKAINANQLAQEQGLPLPHAHPYLEGLWYPMMVAGVSMIIGLLYIREAGSTQPRNLLMNHVRAYAGILWMALGLLAGWYLVAEQALPKFRSGAGEDLIPAIIYTFILAPIITGGLLAFGWLALKREYEKED